MAHAAILENDREAVDMITRFVLSQPSSISVDLYSSINNYMYRQLRKKTGFPMTRQLFEIALEQACITVTPQSTGNSMSFFCNALWVMRKENTGLPVDREMNEKFLEKCLPYGSKNSAIYFNAVCLYVEMDEYDKALECIDLAKRHNYRDYDGMMERIRTIIARESVMFLSQKNLVASVFP